MVVAVAVVQSMEIASCILDSIAGSLDMDEDMDKVEGMVVVVAMEKTEEVLMVVGVCLVL